MPSKIVFLANLPDGTELDAWIEGSKFIITAVGTGHSLAEIGQQFAWLGTALRSSRYDAGIATCSPFVLSTHTENCAAAAQGSEPIPLTEIFSLIGFKLSSL